MIFPFPSQHNGRARGTVKKIKIAIDPSVYTINGYITNEDIGMAINATFPRGSVWRKWDLHVHSPLSILNNQFAHKEDGEPDWDAYLSKLEQADFSVISITDYFTIEGYKEVRRQRDAGRLRGVDTILPNIEFRLKTIVSSRKEKEEIRLNFHVIFSNELDENDIEEHLWRNQHGRWRTLPHPLRICNECGLS